MNILHSHSRLVGDPQQDGKGLLIKEFFDAGLHVGVVRHQESPQQFTAGYQGQQHQGALGR